MTDQTKFEKLAGQPELLAELDSKIKSNTTEDNTRNRFSPCLITGYSKSSTTTLNSTGEGYPRIAKKRKTDDGTTAIDYYRCHMVSRLAENHRQHQSETGDVFQSWNTKTHSVSHDCHRKSCTNIHHLTVMTNSENKSKSINCSLGVECPTCNTFMLTCEHTVKCIPVISSTCSKCSGPSMRDSSPTNK